MFVVLSFCIIFKRILHSFAGVFVCVHFRIALTLASLHFARRIAYSTRWVETGWGCVRDARESITKRNDIRRDFPAVGNESK